MTKLDDVILVHYVPPTGIEPYIEAQGVLRDMENALEKYFEDCKATGASDKEIWGKFNREAETCVEPYQKELDRGSKEPILATCAIIGAVGVIYHIGADMYDRVYGKKK